MTNRTGKKKTIGHGKKLSGKFIYTCVNNKYTQFLEFEINKKNILDPVSLIVST